MFFGLEQPVAEVLTKRSQLEAGLYDDAKRQKLTLSGYLAELARKGEIGEELYREELEVQHGLDPFKQLLMAGGVRTKGALAQTGDAFFSDSANRVLFPEFVSREYRDQERELPAVFVQLSDLVTNREGIQGNAYKAGMMSAPQGDELEFGRVSEGAELPKYTVKQAERAIDLYKYGGMLELTYESVRRIAIPMLSRYIGKIARAQVRRKIKRALAVALNGDGNMNPAPNSPTGTNALRFQDLIDLIFEGAALGSETSLLIGDASLVGQAVALFALTADGRPVDRPVAFNAAGGTLPAPLGMVLKLALPGSILEGSGKLLSVDSADGLVEVYENGSEITESDRLITSQFERITFSENLGYAKPTVEAFRTKTLAV